MTGQISGRAALSAVVAAALLVALVTLVAACGGSDEPAASGGTTAPEGYPSGSFDFYVATPPSGGGAVAAENISKSLKDSGLVDGNIQTLFRPGGSGTVGFTVFQLEAKGKDDAEDLFRVDEVVAGDKTAPEVSETGCKVQWPA